ncbi:hypothetical protein TVAG_192360 [Trichomonas vaginalis G3]|uniref:CLASP N-terminal domain-containing protein n=1 Tax=Trichomonas vaginalis (strain ATCC PRA-98 / G3) TaxID=412133 RepID=A2DGV0_TRIV3|nr:microtubule binding CLASP family [Trichomonas vaginalis G3]EAY20260.1 hypothetical protein TVAG_192360 [Trichomonas vaginalis G3]KAI5529132.1 microtubule binding CLASP family [Trichomonas vaginalis G3]|eukprot:XP_001581246.1 hypothetical protein [Trichomonas vaginalis G3]
MNKPSKIPSTNDITEQTREEFNHPDDDIEPIQVNSEKEAETELDQLIQKIDERQEWDTQVEFINRGMGLVKGGALEYTSFKKGLPSIYHGLISAATNLRSALLKRACLFIAQLAKETGSSFDLLGDYIGPLSSLFGHGTQIIADSTKFAVLSIVTNSPSKKVLLSIFDLCNSKGATQRAVASESISIICSIWPSELLESSFDKFEQIIIKYLADASSETRIFARNAVRNLGQTNPSRYQSILSKIDERTKKAIESAEPTPRTETRVYKKVQRPAPREINTEKEPDQKDQINKNKELLREQQKQKLQEFAKQKKHNMEEKESRIPTKNRSETPRKIIKQPSSTKSSIPVLHHKVETRPNRSSSVKSNHQNKRLGKLPTPPDSHRSTISETRTDEEKHRQSNVIKRTYSFDGDEKKFLNKIKIEIKSGHIEDLRDDIASIGTTVLQSCLNKNSEIQKIAFNILSDLLDAFATYFSNVLPKIITLLLRTTQNANNRELQKTARNLLGHIPEIFPPSDVINGIMEQQSLSPELLLLANSLAKNASLSDNNLIQRLLHIVLETSHSSEVSSRHSAGEILRSIFNGNRPAFDNFVKNLPPSEKDSFTNFIKSYVPGAIPKETASTTSNQNEAADFPKYSEKNHDKWLSEVEKFCTKHENIGDYNDFYGIVFQSLNESLIQHKDPNTTLVMIAKIIKKHGTLGFQVILEELLKIPDSKPKDNVLAAIFNSKNGLKDLVSSLSSIVFESPNSDSAERSISMMTRLIVSNTLENVQIVAPTIGKTATVGINSESSSVRKSSVLCFVEIKCKSQELGDNYINQLLPQQQKLVSIYYQKRN